MAVKKKTASRRSNGAGTSKERIAKKSVKTKTAKGKEATSRAKNRKRPKAPGSSRPRTQAVAKQPPLVEPGPPSGTVPPVEEPVSREEAIGVVTHYYSHLGVAVVQVNQSKLHTGDNVRIKGHTTDFTQQIGSMEYEHAHVDEASPGQSVGIKVVDHVRQHDIVFHIL